MPVVTDTQPVSSKEKLDLWAILAAGNSIILVMLFLATLTPVVWIFNFITTMVQPCYNHDSTRMA